MEFTVVGEPVNIAWRLQELTKIVGADVLMGLPLLRLVEKSFATGPEESHELHGQGTFTFVRLLIPDSKSLPEWVAKMD